MKTLLLLFLFIFSAPTFADDVEDGIAAFRNREFAKAFEVLTPYAESGNAAALKYIGLIYWNGYSVPTQASLGCDYFEQASLQQEEDATSLLGLCYFTGSGREENMNKAHGLLKKDYKLGSQTFLDWLAVAALTVEDYPLAMETALTLYAHGDNTVTEAIGIMYRDGKGIKQNYETGCDWFEKSANSGDSNGMYLYAECLYFGEGRPQDKKTAYTYIKKAADLGDEEAIKAEKEIRKELYGE